MTRDRLKAFDIRCVVQIGPLVVWPAVLCIGDAEVRLDLSLLSMRLIWDSSPVALLRLYANQQGIHLNFLYIFTLRYIYPSGA